MSLYHCMKEFAQITGVSPAEDLPHPELGQSLSLLHSCLLEAGLDQEESPAGPVCAAGPEALQANHLSRFVVAFLPFNSITGKEETNLILFQVYAFLRWLDKRDIAHGWNTLDYSAQVRSLTADQARCLQVSHWLDDETGRVLDDPPQIVQTVSDLFRVLQKEGEFLILQGLRNPDPLRLRLPGNLLQLIRPFDHLDLVLGDTSERWVLLEAGQVFPDIETPVSSSRP